MRIAGRVVAEMHEAIRAVIRPGVTTASLDRIGREVLERRGATSNFLGYHGYPAVICASPNEVVVHGIPDDRVLDEGDIVSIDCGAIVDGWHGDAAFTTGVGEIAPEWRRFIEVADAALAAGIETMVEGNRLGDYGAVVEAVARDAGYERRRGLHRPRDRARHARAAGGTQHGTGGHRGQAPRRQRAGARADALRRLRGDGDARG